MERIGAKKRRAGELLEGYLFISPWLLGTMLFTIGPIVASFVLAFTRWDLFSAPRFIGIANFTKLSHDPLFYKSIICTVYYAVVAVPGGLALALLLAMLVDNKLRGIAIFRTAFFLPNIVSGIAILILWKWLFEPNFGLINEMMDATHLTSVLAWFGIGKPQWLASPGGAVPAMIVLSLWGVGGSMMIFLAGLQNIPKELIEAAEVDGAGWWSRFRNVTLPILTPTIFFLMVVGIAGAVQTFNQAYVMTNGGPANSTLFYCLYIFRNAFEQFRMGIACAMGMLLFVAILILTLIQWGLSKKWVFYQ